MSSPESFSVQLHQVLLVHKDVSGAVPQQRKMADSEPYWLQDRLDGLNRLARQAHDAQLEEDDILHRIGKQMVRLLCPKPEPV